MNVAHGAQKADIGVGSMIQPFGDTGIAQLLRNEEEKERSMQNTSSGGNILSRRPKKLLAESVAVAAR